METKTETKSLLARILDGAAEAIKRPFVEKRLRRSLDTAADSIEEQLMDNEALLASAREAYVNAAKADGNLKAHVQKLIDLQLEKINLENAKSALATEKKALLD